MKKGRYAASDGSFNRSTGAAAGRGALLLLVAVALGIVLLQATDDGADTETARKSSPTTSNTTVQSSTPTTAATNTAPAAISVIVLNGAEVGGIAAKYTDQLKDADYKMLEASNTTEKVEKSVVYYRSASFSTEAELLAEEIDIPTTSVDELPSQRPFEDVPDADIIVVIGTDLAD